MPIFSNPQNPGTETWEPEHGRAMAWQRRGAGCGSRAIGFPAACGLRLTRCRRGCIPQAGTWHRQRRLDAAISAFRNAGAFDASAVADAGLGCRDTDRSNLERFTVAEAHPQ